MNSINLFPVEEKQTLRAEKLKFSFSFSGYGSYMTISDKDKELTIYLDDKSVKDQIIFNINNLSTEYSRDKTFFILLFTFMDFLRLLYPYVLSKVLLWTTKHFFSLEGYISTKKFFMASVGNLNIFGLIFWFYFY